MGNRTTKGGSGRPVTNTENETMNERSEGMAAAARYGGGEYRPPSGSEFRSLLARWELTGGAAGDLVGVKGRQIRRYTGGDTPVPYAVLFTLAMKLEGVSISVDRWRVELGVSGDL